MALAGYTFREAEERDFPGIERLFDERKSSLERPAGWTTWKYRRSPDGQARVFVAVDPAGTIVGIIAYLPRQFTSAKTGALSVMQALDVFVSPELRTKSVFLGLVALARRQMQVPKLGLPNEFSRIFGLRAGWRELGRYDNWRFPVQVGEFVTGQRDTLMARMVNGLCGIYTSFFLPADSRIQLQPVDRFRRDYRQSGDLIHGVRSADYLNWRFVDNPVVQYSSLEFLEGDEAIGYCVYARQNGSAELVDFVTLRHRRGCLRRLIDHCQEQGLAFVNVAGVGLRLGTAGFVRRGAPRDCTAFDLPHGRWVLTRCDTDFEVGSALADAS